MAFVDDSPLLGGFAPVEFLGRVDIQVIAAIALLELHQQQVVFAGIIENTELAGISKQELKDILDINHKVALELIELMNLNLFNIKEELLKMAYGSVTKKTAATILKFANKMNKSIGVSNTR